MPQADAWQVDGSAALWNQELALRMQLGLRGKTTANSPALPERTQRWAQAVQAL